MPDISVIVPAYRPSDFEPLKFSMAANGHVNAEWIVVDDGSGADYDLVFAALDDTPARVVRLPENRRQAAARNFGLAQARAGWIKFLDADDRLDARHLVALLAAADGLPEKAIPFAPTKHVFANGTVSVNQSWRDLPLEPMAQLRRQLVRPFLHHGGALFPRRLLEEGGGYDEELITDEDGDLLLRLLIGGAHFVPIEETNYVYIHHESEGRISTDNDVRKLRARRRVCDKAEEALSGPGSSLTPEIRQALAQRLDKIAMAYWLTDRQEAQELLAKAQALYPGYQSDMPAPLRLLRQAMGPAASLAATAAYRRLRGRPKGGAQG